MTDDADTGDGDGPGGEREQHQRESAEQLGDSGSAGGADALGGSSSLDLHGYS